MGDVIEFRNRVKPERQSEQPAGDAQILFFVGVRYMRMEEPVAETTDAPTTQGSESGGGRKRRRRARV